MIRTHLYIFNLFILVWVVGCRQSYRQESMSEAEYDKIATTRQSLQYIDELIEESGGSPELYLRKARLASDQQDWNDAEDALERYIDLHEPTEEVLFLKAKVRFNKGEILEAQELAEMLFEKGYTSIGLNELLYEIYFQNDEFLKSLDQINLALEKKPGDARYEYWRAKNYLQLNDTTLALENMKAAFNKGYRSTGALTDYLDLLGSIGMEDEALLMAEDAVKKFPGNTELHLIYADLLIDKNQYDKAENTLRGLTGRETLLSEVYTRLGRIKRAGHSYDSANYFLDRAIRENPSHLPAYYLQAEVFRMQGRLQRALDIYRDILDQDSDNPIALRESENLRNYLSYLQRKKEQEQQEEFENRQSIPSLERKSIQN